MTTVIYSTFINELISEIEACKKGDLPKLESIYRDTFAMLVSPEYTPAAADTFEDIEAFEIETDNYNAGGQPIVFIPEILHNGLEVEIQGSDVEWRFLNGNVGYIIIYQQAGTEKIPTICQGLSEENLVSLTNNNLYVHWSDFYFKITKKQPTPEPPSEEETTSGVLGKGVLGKMILGKYIVQLLNTADIRIS